MTIVAYRHDLTRPPKPDLVLAASMTAVPAPDWTSAACATFDPELFFPFSKASDDARIDAAKAVCAACPIRMACFEWALRVDEQHGVWGGTTEDERAALARPRNQRRKGAAA